MSEGLVGDTRRSFLVSGRVQGVGFRWWTARLARDLGLRGRVQNLPDGRVRVEAAGDTILVERLADSLRKGPPMARVDILEEIESSDDPLPPDFMIIH